MLAGCHLPLLLTSKGKYLIATRWQCATLGTTSGVLYILVIVIALSEVSKSVQRSARVQEMGAQLQVELNK